MNFFSVCEDFPEFKKSRKQELKNVIPIAAPVLSGVEGRDLLFF